VKTLSVKLRSVEESQTLALAAKARDLRTAGIDVVSLTAGEPDFPTPSHIKIAAVRAIEENFSHYTPNEGIPELISAIIAKFERENNLHFSRNQILVSCGAKHSIYNVLQAICNKGDEVVFQSPYWVSYPEMVKLADARPVVIPTTHETNFKITAKQLRKTINSRTKAFIFNSPSNPTGTVYTQGEMEEFAEVFRQTGVFVISDEIYERIVYNGTKHFSIGSIKGIRDQVITVNGVSKAHAMTGWRIGYLGGPTTVVEGAAKVQSQTTSNATSISQKAAVAALTGPVADIDIMVGEFKRRRDYMIDQLSKVSGLDYTEPSGAFYLFPCVREFIGRRFSGKVIRDDASLCEYFLDGAHVAMIPGSAFGANQYVRLSYACSMKDLEKAAIRLRAGFKALDG
jgi:aspartate aminotransferase